LQIIIGFIAGAITGRIIYLYLQGKLWFQKKKKIKEEYPKKESSIKLPKGYTIEYNSVTKRYRPCGDKGHSSAFTDSTKEEAIKHAWILYHSSIENTKNNWAKIEI